MLPPLTFLYRVQVEAIAAVPGGPRGGRSWGWWGRGSAVLLGGPGGALGSEDWVPSPHPPPPTF